MPCHGRICMVNLGFSGTKVIVKLPILTSVLILIGIAQEITRNTGRLNKVELDMNSMTNDHDMESTTKNVQLRKEVTLLGETLTTTRNTLAEVLTKMDILESQGGPG